MDDLTDAERKDLDQIFAKPLSHHQRGFRRNAINAFASPVLVAIAAILLFTYREPTAKQAMIFIVIMQCINSVGYFALSVIQYRQIRIIHNLKMQLQPRSESN